MKTPVPPICEYEMPLVDGRQLGVAEFGTPGGRPVLWFHGTPGARRQVPPKAREMAAKTGVRIIGVERPGVGGSTAHLYDSLLGWADDIRELADHLELARFGIVGLSGGGPYLLACAHEMPDRVLAGAIFGGVAPTQGKDAAAGGITRAAALFEPLLSRFHQPVGTAFTCAIRALHPVADPAFDLFLRFGPARDAEVLGRSDMRAMFIEDLLLGSRVDLHSLVYDVVLFGRPWGFSLRDIRVPIHIWQGDADAFVPFSHGAHQAALIPGAGLTLCPDEGHLAGLDSAVDAIEFILSHWPEPQVQPDRVGESGTTQ